MMNCQKDQFSLKEQITYLNCAYMSPLMKNVEAVGYEAVRTKCTPEVLRPEDFFSIPEALKKAFATLVEINDPTRVAIIPSASYGLSTVANNITLKEGEEILIADEQFPSNYYPWARLADRANARIKVVGPTDGANRTRSWNENILQSIHDRTKVVTLGHVHWADGTWFDLKKIRKRTHEVGAYLIIDGTQSVGALPFSVRSIQPDALICAGYKWLLGPYSIGVAYFGPRFDGGIPIEENWINRKHSEDFAGLVNFQTTYQPKAFRYSVGEQSNFILVPMLTAAIEQLNTWGVEQIQHYCKSISTEFVQSVQSFGYQAEEEYYRCGHLFGIRLPVGIDIQQLKTKLAQQSIFVSVRGSAIRISPHLYNQKEDFDTFLSALQIMTD